MRACVLQAGGAKQSPEEKGKKEEKEKAKDKEKDGKEEVRSA